MDMPVNVPVDNPNADTEWNDILRERGIIPPRPSSPTPIIQEALREAREKAHENRLENKDLDELDELEDEEDESFLDHYRQQRLAELSSISRHSVFNQVYHLQKPDYTKDVTEASSNVVVLVHLTSSLGTNTESRILTELWRETAKKYGEVKFCEMKANMCIEGYPERNTPTILVYKDGDIKRQIVTLKEFKGKSTSLKDLEALLVDVGAIKSTDSRIIRPNEVEQDTEDRPVRSGKVFSTDAGGTAHDDDWD
ncbi:uncharacterized protein KY384_001209 [Bacidia gigantensis]|uniref:uncharacterized protein n=1 Tax=Bacidia gigantensis TaxID=2732470 RepID=UPI001D036AEE|nr:uncharacterized protein KY384_001209 [Bacidia gigantensis]KAG8534364.1 hypothetical protein KY384_001209 [Bacidia gigantensis]